jgi:hypothetical protein
MSKQYSSSWNNHKKRVFTLFPFFNLLPKILMHGLDALPARSSGSVSGKIFADFYSSTDDRRRQSALETQGKW